MQRAASIEPRCQSAPGDSDLAAVADHIGGHQSPLTMPKLSWRNVVIGMAVHDSVAEARLLQAAADTWLRMVGGADLLLMTDADDPRNASSIAPRTGADVRVHVYRCAECRGQRCATGGGRHDGACAGFHEGWLARRKILHLFIAMARRFGVAGGDGAGGDGSSDGGNGGSSNAKHFFLKVDPDTVPVPHNLLRLLVELHRTLGPRQPYFFGMAACRVATFPLCHAAGGAGYGLSRHAVGEFATYMAAEYPRFLARVDKFTYGGEDVAVAFALKKQCGAAVINAGCLYQHAPQKYAKLHAKGEEWVRWPLTTTPASFHKFKDSEELRAFFACALYDAHGRPRPSPRSLLSFAQNSSSEHPASQPSGRVESQPPCADAWRAPPNANRPHFQAAESQRVLDGGLTHVTHAVGA